jgi:hypothetical protein
MMELGKAPFGPRLFDLRQSLPGRKIPTDGLATQWWEQGWCFSALVCSSPQRLRFLLLFLPVRVPP